jgi:mRNA-degrading endonuclease toxin of MazEF toxin-antitoxin module
VIAGQIVTIDWRDALAESREPNKRRPGIIVGSARFFDGRLPFELVVPLTGKAALSVSGATTLIQPRAENGCTKPCYALAWNVQCVPHARITETPSHVNADELRAIRSQIAACSGN